MVFLSFLDTNLAFFALGAYNLNFSGYALEHYNDIGLNNLQELSNFLPDMC